MVGAGDGSLATGRMTGMATGRTAGLLSNHNCSFTTRSTGCGAVSRLPDARRTPCRRLQAPCLQPSSSQKSSRPQHAKAAARSGSAATRGAAAAAVTRCRPPPRCRQPAPCASSAASRRQRRAHYKVIEDVCSAQPARAMCCRCEWQAALLTRPPAAPCRWLHAAASRSATPACTSSCCPRCVPLGCTKAVVVCRLGCHASSGVDAPHALQCLAAHIPSAPALLAPYRSATRCGCTPSSCLVTGWRWPTLADLHRRRCYTFWRSCATRAPTGPPAARCGGAVALGPFPCCCCATLLLLVRLSRYTHCCPVFLLCKNHRLHTSPLAAAAAAAGVFYAAHHSHRRVCSPGLNT